MKLTTENTEDTERELSTIHRWIERNHPDGVIDSLTYSQNLERVADRWYERLERVERERDDALSQIVQAECRAERFCQERDEARDIIRKAIMKFFEDDSDGRIAAGMLAILCKKEPVSQ
jgi:hypothetical protein